MMDAPRRRAGSPFVDLQAFCPAPRFVLSTSIVVQRYYPLHDDASGEYEAWRRTKGL